MNIDSLEVELFCSYKDSFPDILNLIDSELNEYTLSFLHSENNYIARYTILNIPSSKVTLKQCYTLKEEGCGCDWSKLLTDESCHNKRFK